MRNSDLGNKQSCIRTGNKNKLKTYLWIYGQSNVNTTLAFAINKNT